jgi:hypothetical protein
MTSAGVALAGSVLPGPRESATTGIHSAAQAGVTVIVQGAGHALPAGFAKLSAGDRAVVVRLEADPVRQWRGVQAGLLGARSTRLIGATSWPEFLLVRGLAEASGRRVRHQRSDAAAGTIIWLIA